MLALRPKTIQRGAITSLVVAVFTDRVLDIFHHRIALCLGNTGGLIQQVDDGHPIAGPQELHFGQRQHDQQKHERTKAKGDKASPGP